MADSLGNQVDGATHEPLAAADEGELDQVLDAAQQAWEQGDTLAIWVDLYPAYALQLGELALSLERQRHAPAPTAEEIAAAGISFQRAMDVALGPVRNTGNSG